MLWVCPPIIIQITSISHTKGQYFNRAPNLFSAPRLWLSRTPQIRVQKYISKRQKEKQFFIPLLCLIQLNFCNSIKIEKQQPEVFCMKRFGKLDVLCFLETPVLRFALLPYYEWLSKSFFQKTFIWKGKIRVALTITT